MVTKLGPLCKVKLLKNNGDKAEKAGVGGSTPSLATIIPKNLTKLWYCPPSPLSVRFHKGPSNGFAVPLDCEGLRLGRVCFQSAFSPLWSVSLLRISPSIALSV